MIKTNYIVIVVVLIFLSTCWHFAFSFPCEDYSCDSLMVRAILDSNGMSGYSVDNVSDSSKGRINVLMLSADS